jgi:hypothetical protein
MDDNNNKVCFIISNKYVKGYVSFIDYYVGNIQQLYKDSLIIIVDNNSVDLTDVYAKLNKYSNDKLVYAVVSCIIIHYLIFKVCLQQLFNSFIYDLARVILQLGQYMHATLHIKQLIRQYLLQYFQE